MADKKVVIFSISDLEYGILGEHVQSIEKMQPITRVPFARTHIQGVFNLRGIVIPVLSLSSVLEKNSSIPLEDQKIIIVRFRELEIGLIIDEAHDVLNVIDTQIEPMDEKLNLSHLFAGVLKLDKRLISILNIERVLYPDGKED